MTELSYRIEGLERIGQKLDLAHYAGELSQFFESAAMFVERGGKERSPVDRGQLRSSLTHEVDSSQPPLWAKVGTDVFHAPYQEFGTGLLSDGPGQHSRFFPPSDALEVWAQRHGFESGFLVARAIWQAGGTRPRRFLRGALEDAKGKIVDMLRELGAKVRQKWDGG